MRKIWKEVMGMTLVISMTGTSISTAAPIAAGREAGTVTITSDQMEVLVDEDFPRVIEYHLDGKTMYGQDENISQVKINNQLYTPSVTAQANGNKVSYDMTVAELGATIHADLEVKENVLEFNVTGIEESEEKVKRFEIPNHGLLSIHGSQPGAAELGIDVKGGVIYSNTAIEERNNLEDMGNIRKDKTYLILNTDELAGAITTNAMNIYAWGSEPENRNISYANETKITYEVSGSGADKKLSAGSFPWTYREYDEEAMDLPYAKVVITGDANGTGTVDWQDGAVAYREILPVPKLSEEAKKSFFHIAYTRASLAQWPFDKTLDMVKKLYLYTDGFGQFLQYKGYQAEGHDSNHPDYGDSFNSKAGGVEGLNNLATEALKYNCNVGVHLNHTEAYPEAKNYSYDLVTKSKGWDSLDLSMRIDRYKDAVNDGEGGLGYRLNQLKEAVPDLKWIYYDVYEAQGYAQWKLAKETMSPSDSGNCEGFAVASEFQGALDPYTIWGHVQCQASPAMRIMRYNTTDQFFYDPILLESRHAGSMGYGDDGNQDQGTQGQTIPDQIDMFYSNNLLFKFMQNHDINETVMFDGEKRFFDEVYFDGGLTGRIVADRDRTSGNGTYGSGETRQPIVELTEDSRLVARYQKKFTGKTTDATVDNSDSGSKRIEPMMAQYLLPWDTELDDPVDTEQGTKLYHYNTVGGITEWELPESWSREKEVTLYQLSDTGRGGAVTLPVDDGIISIDAIAGVPYIVCRNGNNAVLSAEEVDFGQNTVFSDPGFDTKKFGRWELSRPGSAEILASTTSGETFVEIKGAEESTVSQKITGLEEGKTYQLSVWAEVDGRTATLGIKNGGSTFTNDMHVSEINNNYYNSLRYNDAGNRMQRLKLEFTAEAADAEVFIRANAGDGTVDFDDFRLIEKEETEWAQEPPEDAVFFWDFEMANDEGWGPFVPVQNVNRAHISEAHSGYTADTIQGKYSFKIRDSVGGYNHGEAVRTIASNMKLENGKEYTIQFDYWMKSKEAYDVTVSAGYVPGHQTVSGGGKNNVFCEKLDYEKTAFSKTFTVPDDGREYGLSFFKNLPDKEELIIDNLALYEGKKELEEKDTPTYDFDSGDVENSGEWLTALGGGSAKTASDISLQSSALSLKQRKASPSDAEEALDEEAITEYIAEDAVEETEFLTRGEGKAPYGSHLEVVSDRTDTIILDNNTRDIQNGSMEFDVTAKDAYTMGVVVRYIDSENHLNVSFGSEADGWRYTSVSSDMEAEADTDAEADIDTEADLAAEEDTERVSKPGEKSGIMNMPGIPLQAKRKQHVEFTFEGSHYTLKVDGVTLFDDEIEGLREEAGRLGFVTNSKTPVCIDNLTITGDQVEEGQETEIKNEGGGSIQKPGEFTTFTFDDAYVQGGSTAGQNFGGDSIMKVKNDTGNYWRQAYMKFPLPNTTANAVDTAIVKLYMAKVGTAVGTENVYIVSNDWNESDITAENAPEAGNSAAATFDPKGHQGESVEVDLTDAVKAALESGEEYISLAVQHAEATGGSTDIEIAAFEYGNASCRPKLEVKYDEAATGIQLNKNELKLGEGEEEQLIAVLIPEVPDAVIDWESGNEDVATVDGDGVVTAVGKGNTVITASYDGATAKCKVSVRDIVSVPVSEDTFVQDDMTEPAAPEKNLRLKNGQTGYNRNIYLKFVIPDGISSEEMSKATIDLFLTDLNVQNKAETISLIPVDPAEWSEDTLTWKNRKPLSDAGAMTYPLYSEAKGNNTVYSLDITSYLKKAVDDGKEEISFAIKNTKDASGYGFDLYSKEGGGEGRPATVLVISSYEKEKLKEKASPSDAVRQPGEDDGKLPEEKPSGDDTKDNPAENPKDDPKDDLKDDPGKASPSDAAGKTSESGIGRFLELIGLKKEKDES